MFTHRFESITFWQHRRARSRRAGLGYGWSGRLPLVLVLGAVLVAALVWALAPAGTGVAAKALRHDPGIKPVDYNIQVAPDEIKPVDYNIQAAPEPIQPVDYNIQAAPEPIQPVNFNIQAAPELIPYLTGGDTLQPL